MKKLLIALATTVALAGPAAAAPLKRMPAEYLGNWCEDHILDGPVVYYRCTDHCELGKALFVVRPTWFEDKDIIRCRVTKVGEMHDAARPVWSRCTHLIKGWKSAYRSSFWRQDEFLAVHWYEPPDVELGHE